MSDRFETSRWDDAPEELATGDDTATQAPAGAADGQPRFAIARRLRERLVFHRLNLANRPYPMPGPLDAVFCRNVMIYFDLSARRRVLARFHEKLRDGGWLLLGHSESLLNVTADFEMVHLTRDLVYRKPLRGGEGAP